jgi:glycosyltransferase 2 family protein
MKSNKILDIAKIVFVIGLVAWAVFKFDSRMAGEILRAADLKWGILSIALVFAALVLFSYRWQNISKGIWPEIKIPMWYFLYLNLTASFYVLFIPTSIAGETARVLKLNLRTTKEYKKTILSVAMDRFLGLATWIVIFAAMPLPFAFNKLWLLLLLPIGGIVVFKSKLKILEHEIFDFSRHHPADAAIAAALSLAGQLIIAVSAYAAFRCFLINIPFFSALGLAATGALAMMVPLSWLGVSMRETSFVAMLPQFGVNTTTALLVAGFLVISNFIMGFAGGIWELSHVGWNLSKLKLNQEKK